MATKSRGIHKHRPATTGTLRGRPRSPRTRPPAVAPPRSQAPKPKLSRGSIYTLGSVVGVLVLAALFTVPRPSEAVFSLVSPALAPDEKPAPQTTVAVLQGVTLKQLVASSQRKGLKITPPATLPVTAPLLTSNGKPEVVDLCNEYNGYCADVSWPLVMALEKFGTFHSIGYVTALGSYNPGTVGLDFYRSSYSSKYISFSGVEMFTAHLLKVNTWQQLQAPTSTEETLLSNWDISPYASPAHATPFIDFGGDYYMASPGYGGSGLEDLAASPLSALKGTAVELAAGASPLSWAVQDLAARMVGAICLATHNTPPVCNGLPKSLEKPPQPTAFNQEVQGPSTTTG